MWWAAQAVYIKILRNLFLWLYEHIQEIYST